VLVVTVRQPLIFQCAYNLTRLITVARRVRRSAPEELVEVSWGGWLPAGGLPRRRGGRSWACPARGSRPSGGPCLRLLWRGRPGGKDRRTAGPEVPSHRWPSDAKERAFSTKVLLCASSSLEGRGRCWQIATFFAPGRGRRCLSRDAFERHRRTRWSYDPRLNSVRWLTSKPEIAYAAVVGRSRWLVFFVWR
jgi:hypothetical protein